MSDVYRLVRSLRDQQLSRNRHFDAHATPLHESARRLDRFLRGLERDLARAERVQLVRIGAGAQLTLEFPAVRLRRTVRLAPEELALLAEDSRFASRLRAADAKADQPAAAAASGAR